MDTYLRGHFWVSQVDDHTYFEDVELQATAKWLGEQYSKTNPPKQVDVMQAS